MTFEARQFDPQRIGSEVPVLISPHLRSFNERVLERTKACMSYSQFDQFQKLLDNDIRRFESLMEMEDLGEEDY